MHPQEHFRLFAGRIWFLIVVLGGTCLGAGDPNGKSVPSATLLYHSDGEVRIATIQALAARRDMNLIDDLIRAYGIELRTDVGFAYEDTLRQWTGRALKGVAAWKSWLQTEVDAGRLKRDYQPIVPADLDPSQRAALDPLALQLGPEHFTRFAEMLRGDRIRRGELFDALRYMVANDHLDPVRQFLGGECLSLCLAQKDLELTPVVDLLNHVANPGPLRDRINEQVGCLLDSDDPTIVANALHLLAGIEGGAPGLEVPGVADKVRALLNSPDPAIAVQARRALYGEAFRDLHAMIGMRYPCFALKGIDWQAVGREMLPRVESIKTDDEFGRLCQELVARLQDSHAVIRDGSAKVPQLPFPQWDGGFACLEDDQGRAVVYWIAPGGPAARAGLPVGHIVTHVNDQPVQTAIETTMRLYRKYVGYSSNRCLRYDAFRLFARQDVQDAPISLNTIDTQGEQRVLKMQTSLKAANPPRLPVPNPGIADNGTISWKKLDNDIGYIYVRRISTNLVEKLDRAVGDLRDVHGLIVDVRGNSGGGFDSKTAHVNFMTGRDAVDSNRPRFEGPMALLVDERCISAAEGWASWFIAHKRARVFGQATAGASSRKIEYTLKNGLYKVSLPVKAYNGSLDRPIELRGLEPDVPLRPNAQDIAQGRDTVLLAAVGSLLTQQPNP